MGFLSRLARSSASGPHGYHSTGLCACFVRYGLVSEARRFVYFGVPSLFECLGCVMLPCPALMTWAQMRLVMLVQGERAAMPETVIIARSGVSRLPSLVASS